MSNRIKIILLVIFVALLAASCKKEEIEEPIIAEEPIEVEIEETVVEEIPEKIGIPSPLSGIYGVEEKVNRRPVAIMFDNHNGARWQSGLKDAEIVYEYLVEAPYTRYLGIYLLNDPSSIGPIRSARPYFITTVLEYDAVYVRVGGSNQAMADVKSLRIADIDGLSSSNKVFWRVSHKKMPHNLYSSMEAIRTTQEERKYRMMGEFTPFKFKEDGKLNGTKGSKIIINYNKNNKTEYIYKEEDKIYSRYKDGKLHIDEIDESPIVAKNIIIQRAKTKVLDKEGRLDIQLIGQGEGLFLTNGEYIDIKWVKESREGKTKYYDENGSEIELTPGVTWIQVIEPKTEVIIE
ncbi:MAG: DUF3048 domain-containing protein [Tissierellaceae bacterium]|nr:DUF3048 domain-containing protein [Tissierellaceae bacterium]